MSLTMTIVAILSMAFGGFAVASCPQRFTEFGKVTFPFLWPFLVAYYFIGWVLVYVTRAMTKGGRKMLNLFFTEKR